MRGHIEKEGNLPKMLFAWSYSAGLKHWTEAAGKYMSHDTINELITITGNTVLREKLRALHLDGMKEEMMGHAQQRESSSHGSCHHAVQRDLGNSGRCSSQYSGRIWPKGRGGLLAALEKFETFFSLKLGCWMLRK